ncbi:MAG: asparagine synthase (glutamine-hydrolyzing) [Desulfobacterales bacterium]|nr:asparagine synthase (glutamine-hydrolyzing) [Desulfobacterales bacterium]
MCGICGKISYDSGPVDEGLLRKMCRSFSYRGPDDEGIYINEQSEGKNGTLSVGLGHKRLSIIDLSQAGHQPMSNEDGTIWLTYNGEIYNFRELRAGLEKKGHTFRSNSDTEVILHLYEEEGIQSVQRLNGMFAFGLFEEKPKRLFLCRDRIGIKPLVYYWDGKKFAFASEIKALLSDHDIPKELDYEALYLYLTFSYVPAPFTIFKGIRKLEPGHFLVLENKKLRVEKYWDVPLTMDTDDTSLSFLQQEEIYKKRLYECISEAVRERMIADVPLGAFLSGGIDSSIIVAMMSRHSSEPIKTFSIGFKDDKLFDETRYARDVANLFKTDHHEFKLTYKDMLEVLPNVISTFDEPFSDSSAIPTYIVSRETKKYVTVSLSGDGGDELFAGYRSYLGEYWYKRYMMIPSILRKGLIERIIQALPDSRDIKLMEYIRRLKKFIRSTRGTFPERVLSLKEIFPKDIRQNILLLSRNNWCKSRDDQTVKWVQDMLGPYQRDRMNSILYVDLKNSLPGDMLAKVDWMSMKNSLEVRVPFLDHRVVELAFKMQGSLKLHKGKTKYILKEAFKDLLPPSLYHRPKAGFEVPISRWLKTDLRFLIEQYLSRDRISKQGIFDYKVVDSLIRDLLDNKTDPSWMLWNLIVFQCWYESYLL